MPSLLMIHGVGCDASAWDAMKPGFEAAGWTVQDGVMTSHETGTPFRFEILLYRPSDQRIALAYAALLKRIGVEARVRLVDSSQFALRKRTYDYDVLLPERLSGSLSPGAEQGNRFSSLAADAPGAWNYAGVRDPAVDALIEALGNARSRTALVDAARALDRTILAGGYVLPLHHETADRLAWATTVKPPEQTPLWGFVRWGVILRLDAWSVAGGG